MQRNARGCARARGRAARRARPAQGRAMSGSSGSRLKEVGEALARARVTVILLRGGALVPLDRGERLRELPHDPQQGGGLLEVELTLCKSLADRVDRNRGVSER